MCVYLCIFENVFVYAKTKKIKIENGENIPDSSSECVCVRNI